MQKQSCHIFHAFSNSVHWNSSKDALIFVKESGTYHSETYHAVYQKSLAFARLLKSSSVTPGDRVVILMENRPEFSWVCFSIFLLGGVVVPLDTQYASDTLEKLLRHCGSSVIVSSKKFMQEHEKISGIKWLCVDSSEVCQAIIDDAVVNDKPAVPVGGDVAALFYTSGTTADPKAVVLTHRNLLANIDSIEQTGLVKPEDVVVSILPLHHTYAFTVTFLCPLLCGMSIVYPKSLASTDLLACIKQTCATVFVGVPQIFAMIHRAISDQIKDLSHTARSAVRVSEGVNFFIRKRSGINLGKGIFQKIHQRFGSSLRMMVSGGARLDPRIARDFYQWGFTLVEGYGLTETSPVVSFSVPAKPKFGSVGKPLPGVDVCIDHPDGQGQGEVLIRGENVMRGYYEMGWETQKVLRNGWFYTGDIGRLDQEGFLFLTGRKKEMIVLSNGENINPEELEQYYGENPFLKEVAVLTVKDPKKTVDLTQLTAIIVPNEEHFREEKELNVRQRLRWELENYSVKLPTYKRIKGFVISQEALPRTRLGKLRRFELEKIYYRLQESSADPVKDAVIYSDALKSVVNYVEKRLGRSVSPSDHLELDLGLDSLGRLELFTALQQKMNLQLTDEESMDFFSCSTVGQVLDRLKMAMQKEKQGDEFVDKTVRSSADLPILALSYLEEYLGYKVSPTDHLELDLGFDSLGRVDLLLKIQQRLGLSLSDEDAMRFFMCGRVCDLLDEMNRFAGSSSQNQVDSTAWKDVLFREPQGSDIRKVKLKPLSILENILTFFIRVALRIVCMICWRVQAVGAENLPAKGPYILCPNHVSFLDGIFIADALPGSIFKQTFFLGDSRFLDHRILRPFKRMARFIPIEFTHRMAEAMQLCAYILNAHKVLCYFPEGQRSIDGEVKKFRKGIGILVHELGVPVVPVYIFGAFSVWPRGMRWPRLGPNVKVSFGKALSAKELAFRITEAEDVYQRIADNLYAKVLEMSKKK